MGASDKTKQLLRIDSCPLSLLVKNTANPNKMKPRSFDLLCDNMNLTGWTDPALVRPVDLPLAQKAIAAAKNSSQPLVDVLAQFGVQFRIVGGHHRYEAALYLGLTEGPVTVILDPAFDDDQEKFQIVRMNVIHGQMDPNAFVSLMGSLSEKYSDDILQDSFGFAEEAEFRRLTVQLAKSLPNKVAQDKFKEAAKEIKTIDGLAKLLNHMFATYGDTLPYGYMVVDYGGQRSVWIRAEAKTMKALDLIGQMCIAQKRTMDDIVGAILQLIATEGQEDFIQALIADTPYADVPGNLPVLPTKDNLSAIGDM